MEDDLGVALDPLVELLVGLRGLLERKLVNGHYSKSDFNASFVGFAPSRKPAITIIVVIDSPHGHGYYGSVVAAPIFKRIAEASLRYLGVPPTINPPMPNTVRAAGSPSPSTCHLRYVAAPGDFHLGAVSRPRTPSPRGRFTAPNPNGDLPGLVAEPLEMDPDGAGRNQRRQLVRPFDQHHAARLEVLVEPKIQHLAQAVGAIGIEMEHRKPPSILVHEYEGGA